MPARWQTPACVCAIVSTYTGEDTLADQNTINRIGGILKNVYSDAIVEQQNLAAVARKLFTKAKGVRLGGDHYEVSIRIGGNRAGVGARNSDDLLPIPLRQQEKKFLVYDRAVFGVIRVFDKDIQNSKDNKQAFINHLDDEVTQVAKDVMKHMNIMTYGDGTGTLTTVNVGTANTNQFVGATGTTFGKFGTRYLQLNDQIDIWDPTFTVQRTPIGRRGVTNLSPSTQTVTTSVNLTLVAGDVVVRANSANKEYIGLQLGTDNSSAVTFQGLSRGTYSIIQGNVSGCGRRRPGRIEPAADHLSDRDVERRDSGPLPDRQRAMGCLRSSRPVAEALRQHPEARSRLPGTRLQRDPLPEGCRRLPADIFALNSEYCQNGVVTPLSLV